MTRKQYEMQLSWLNDSLEEMSNTVEASLQNLLFAIENRDDGLARQIIRDDHNINRMERGIESQCLALITRQQPIAGDLRFVSSILKVVTDVERIGDHISDIAELILRLNHAQLESYSVHLQPMIDAAREMVHESVSAFISRDETRSAQVIQADDVVDSLFDKVKTDIAGRLKSGGASADACIDILMIAKYLERIGDHAVNICEWEIFKETGTIQDMKVF